jgi:hypothetical protein
LSELTELTILQTESESGDFDKSSQRQSELEILSEQSEKLINTGKAETITIANRLKDELTNVTQTQA